MNINLFKKVNLLSTFIIFFIFLKFCKGMIVIPIESLDKANYILEQGNSHSNIIKNYYFKDLYTILEIGTPIQKVFLFIRTNHQDYEIISKTSYNNKNIGELVNNKYNLSNIFQNYNLFNEKKSLSYISEGCKEVLGILDFETICNSNDSFLFYNNINMTKKIRYDNFFFKLIIDSDNDIPGEIGLGLFDKYRDPEYNFLKLLKNNNLINNYNWYFQFDSYLNKNGKLILGSLPHEDYPKLFSELDLFYINVDINSFTLKNWRLEFDKIYTSNNINLSTKKIEFVFDSDIIIGTNELESKLNEYCFNNFIFNKLCFNDSLKLPSYYYQGLKYFYCTINLKNTLYDLLPYIKLYLNEFNYTFEIPNEDLFIITEKYIYLKILFPVQIQQNYLILGRSFTLKYPFVFNPDLNRIGFYRIYNKSDEMKVNSNIDNIDRNKLKIIIKISTIIILIIIMFFSFQ